MNLIYNKLFPTFFFFFIINIYALCCQDSVLILANKLFQAREYYEAITEYKRFLCFHPQHEQLSYTYLQIGMAHAQLKEWEKAVANINQSINLARSETIKEERRISLGQVYIACKKYGQAEMQLLKVYYFTKSLQNKSRAAYLLSILYIYTYAWQDTLEMINQYFDINPHLNQKQKEEINRLLMEAVNQDYKSPDVARTLSFILPGSGQIYAGDCWQGLNSLALNGGIGFLIGLNIYEGNYLDALMIFIYLFNRFYWGSIYHADRLAHEHNETLNSAIREKIINQLLCQ